MIIKSIKLSSYDPLWPQIYAQEARLIRETLGENVASLHHIGSTAVPELDAKPRIDMIAEIRAGAHVIAPLQHLGYKYEGEWNMPLKKGFTKRTPHEFNLHVFREGNAEVQLNILFRDYVRAHPDVRSAYAQLKRQLLADPSAYIKTGFFTGYNYGKANFIRDVILKTGFEGLRFLRPAHDYEWQGFHEILSEAAQREGKEYDRTSRRVPEDGQHDFILCRGVEVVAAARVYKSTHAPAEMLCLAQKATCEDKDYESILAGYIKEWLLVAPVL